MGNYILRNGIYSKLDQNYNKDLYEIMVIENGSTEGTKQFLKESPWILLESNDIQDSYPTKNLGIRHSMNEILYFTDSDLNVDKN